MSFIRLGEERDYFDGNSGAYIYVTGGYYEYGGEPTDELAREGGRIRGNFHGMTEADLAEVALRMVERTDLDEATFEAVEEAMTDEYPRVNEKPPGAPDMASELEQAGRDWNEEAAISFLREQHDAPPAMARAAFDLWSDDNGS